MYEPCFACFNHYGKSYSKQCDETCQYAKVTKQLEEANKKLEQAYQILGEVVDKPNPFTKE